MKLNKKICSVMMILCMGSAFVGCSNKTETTPPTVNIEQKEDVTPEETAPVETEEQTEQADGETEVTTDVETETEQGESVDSVFSTETKAGAIINQIIEGVELPQMMAYDDVILNDVYGIDASTLESYAVGQSLMNVHATEVAVFELKPDTIKDDLLKSLEDRQQSLVKQWESYLPAQLELVQNYKVVEKDNLVLFVISDNADTIVDNFLSINE